MEGFFHYFNDLLAWPATILFFGTAITLTIKTRFLQLRGFPIFLSLLKQSRQEQHTIARRSSTINKFHALFAAMGTSLGMGNIVGPTIAIYTGGPGALFWLVAYMFFASVTKFTEVTFAIHTRIKADDGRIIGGPMEYLKLVSVTLAYWYTGIMSFLLIYWSGLQANTLGQIYAQEAVPIWAVGIGLAIIAYVVLYGGAQRVGLIASRLVPLMVTLYLSFSFFILCTNIALLKSVFIMIGKAVFSPGAAIGGFLGVTLIKAMQTGAFQAIFISEAGLGTSSIPHAVADVKNPTDQGILALYSMAADALLSTMSGLLVLVTGVWMNGEFRSTFIYEAFKMHSPCAGRFVLIGAISLFVITTVIGNIFNGTQTFASLASPRWVRWYLAIAVICVALWPLAPVRLVWEMMNTLLFFVAMPNLIALLILAFKYPDVIKVKKN